MQHKRARRHLPPPLSLLHRILLVCVSLWLGGSGGHVGPPSPSSFPTRMSLSFVAAAGSLSCGNFTGSVDGAFWEVCSDFKPGGVGGASSLSLRVSVLAAVDGGWVGFGFAPVGEGASMANAKVMIGWVNGGTAYIDNYDLRRYAAGNGDTHSLGATAKSASLDPSTGRTVLAFTLPLDPSTGGSAFVAPDGSVSIACARGPTASPGNIPQHLAPRGNIHALNLATGASSSVSDAAALERQRYRAAHGFLMAFAWGLVIPLGIIAARYFKSAGPGCWFVGHQSLVLTGLTMAFAAWIIGLVKIADGNHQTHRALGITAMSLALANPLIAAVRPPPPAKTGEAKSVRRKVWEAVHMNVGRSAYVIALVNCFIGLSYFNHPPGSGELNNNTIAFLVVWLCVMALAVGLEIRARFFCKGGFGAPAPFGLTAAAANTATAQPHAYASNDDDIDASDPAGSNGNGNGRAYQQHTTPPLSEQPNTIPVKPQPAAAEP
jgi:hypothetical protein